MDDFYSILAVPKNATLKEIKVAYRKLARQYHPDLNPTGVDAVYFFRKVSEAYQILSDVQKRKEYDIALLRSRIGNSDHFFQSRPDILFNQSKELLRYANSNNSFSINNDALFQVTSFMVQQGNLDTLINEASSDLIKGFACNILKASVTLKSPNLFREIAYPLLTLFDGKDDDMFQQILSELEWRIKLDKQHRLVPILALLLIGIVVAIMLFILY